MSMLGIRLSRAARPVPSTAQAAGAQVEEALRNITALVRPGKVGYATIWDGNKYVQCRHITSGAMRCEAAGTSMQPSLRNVLTGERLNRIASLGWILDPSFGNYAQTFPADMPTARIADQVLRILSEAYEADAAALEIKTAWVANVPCPPRNGPSQNLAGIVNDAPAMKATAVHACSYVADTETLQKATTAAELITIYGTTVTAEIQRLRINAANRVYAVFDAGIGYVQCMPETPSPAFYCEAQSAESWAALATVLTPDRVSLLRKVGYADPGRAPNYWKSYAFEKYSDAVMANEILTILYDVYGYTGTAKLKIKTEN
jgi:hypothetical protein